MTEQEIQGVRRPRRCCTTSAKLPYPSTSCRSGAR
jgi:hypothetical protein